MKKKLKTFLYLGIILVTIIVNLYAICLVNTTSAGWEGLRECVIGLFILVVIGFPLSITSIVIIIKYIVKNRKK